MAAPLRIDELTATGSLTATAAVAVVQGGQTLQFPASAFITQANSFTPSGSGASSTTVQTELRRRFHIAQYGGVVDSSASGAANVTALNNCVTAAVADGVREIHFDEGLYYFASAPSVFAVGITLVGMGKRTTGLVRNYTPASTTTPFLEWTGATTAADGGGLRNVYLYAGTGTTSGAAIVLTAASSSSRPGHMSFVGLEVSGTGTWAHTIYSDATGVTDAGSQGIRDITFTDCELFNATTKTIHVKNAVNWKFISLGVFQGDGNAPDITIDGGGTAASNSTGVFFDGLNNGGSVTFQNADIFALSSSYVSTLTIESTATNGAYHGIPPATLTVNSTSFKIDKGRATWTPALTFATAGDLSIAYTTQNGVWTRDGDHIDVWFNVTTSTFTHTTASGSVQITGLPVAASSAVTLNYRGSMSVQGITLANFTQFEPHVASGGSLINIHASGSAQSLTAIAAAHMPTGGTVILQGHVSYCV